MRGYILGVALIVATLIWFGCDDDSTLGPDPGPKQNDTLPDLSVTPMENAEAEVAALILSRKLVAPVPLYNRIKLDLETIRDEYSDSIPAVSITVAPPWILSALSLELDTALFNDTTSDAYRRFDSLSSLFGIVEFESSLYQKQYFYLRLEGRLHPVRLVEVYAAAGIEGILCMATTGFRTDWPEVYMKMDADEIKYFFRDAWEDCPSGCIHEEFYYVNSKQGRYTYIGSFKPNYHDPVTVAPPWYDTALTARREHAYSVVWWPDSVIYWP